MFFFKKLLKLFAPIYQSAQGGKIVEILILQKKKFMKCGGRDEGKGVNYTFDIYFREAGDVHLMLRECI